jgi:hypothetical protein
MTTDQIKGDGEMHVSKRKGLALLVCAAFAGSAFSAVGAFGHGLQIPIMGSHVHQVLKSDIIGSVPTDPKIHGVAAGSAPWKIAFGRVHVFSNGGVIVVVKGLLITGTGTANDNTVGPVQKVDAALYCGADTMAAATTKSVTLDAQGDAVIVDKVMLPARCLAPQIVLNPTVGGNAIAGVYIAASGFTTM